MASGLLYLKWTDPPTHVVGYVEEVWPPLLDEGREPVTEQEFAQLDYEAKERTPLIVRREQRVVLPDDVARSMRPPGVQEDLALTIQQAPGDLVALTAAIRDLHKAYPGRFRTVVQSAFPELLENNPYVTPDAEIVQPRRIDCDWLEGPGDGHRHFVQAWRDDLQHKLGVPIPLTSVWGDIHLSEAEKEWPADLLGPGPRPFAIVNAGVKPEWRTKGWGTRNYQAVVDHFADRLEFVQVGRESVHDHQRLSGVSDLLNRTGIRDLCRLVYWSDLVLCPITLVMHLSAAIKRRDGSIRPCVVLAGGIEPPGQVTYDGHVTLSTVGTLPCCHDRPCGRMNLPPSRVADFTMCKTPVEYGDGEWVGRCFDLIQPRRVVDAIETYIAGGQLPCSTGGTPVRCEPVYQINL